MNFLEELKQRGIISNITNEEKVNNFFTKKNKYLYIGFDPSAKSLHLGNYVMISLLKRLKDNGYKVIAVVGGATGMIGDPSGKNSERNLLDEKTIKENISRIKKQIIKYTNAEIFDNYDLYSKMNVINFLREIGKSININHILEREIVKKRLESGLSYTEFSYSIIQGYDFYWLYKNKNVSLQIGGSDQWGNITAGVDYIRRNIGDDNEACGLTINLLTKADGTKFGKSEKGAIYLDPNITSPYEMYQFLLNQADENLEKLFYFFSFKSVKEINKIILEHNQNSSLKLGQKILANELIETIHGKVNLEMVIKISNAIFSNQVNTLNAKELKLAFMNSFHYECFKKEINIIDLLIESKITSSKRESRDLILSKSIYVNNDLITSENTIIDSNKSYNKEFSLIRKGKKNYFLIVWK